MTIPPSGERPQGDGLYRPDSQPWDPAYPHPQPYQPESDAYYGYAFPAAQYPAGQYPAGQHPAGQYQDPYQAGGHPTAQLPFVPPAPPAAPRRSRRGLAGAIAALVAAVLIASVAFVAGRTAATNGTAVAGRSVFTPSTPSTSAPSTVTPSTPSTTTPSRPTLPGNGNFPFPNNGNSNGNGSSTTKASATQQIGVVDIYTVEKYAAAAAAGTGVVLSSDGDILTNNHVVDGATSIKVTVVSTRRTYVAKVVGTAPGKDIALLHVVGASGLQTAALGDSDSVSVGDSVTGVGNAGGTGGAPSAAKGKVTALNRTITASDESGSNSETLRGVIVTDAPIQSGDSGGPLYNSDDKVVGIDTAASTSGASAGFAIPIKNALALAAQIKRGIETSAIHIGYPGFLGISVASGYGNGALVADVVSGGPADTVGITSGDVITRVGSKKVNTSTQLRTAVSALEPGSKVSITYTDPTTGKHKATVTLAAGPAD